MEESKQVLNINDYLNNDVDEIELIRFDNNIKIYFNEINKIKLLTKEEETYLFDRMSKGDNIARDIIINSNLKLVVFIAKKKSTLGIQFQDLIQEGNIGLMKAVEKFDPTKGYKFSTYAVWWIRQEIDRAIAFQAKNISIPMHVSFISKKIYKVKVSLEQKLNREPTDEEIAREMKMSIEDLNKRYYFDQIPLSLNMYFDSENSICLENLLMDNINPTFEECFENEILKKHIKNAFSLLNKREQLFIKLKFGFYNGEPKTLEEIGNLFGITRQCVSAIVVRGLKKIKNSKYESILAEYWDFPKNDSKKKEKTI